jgi:tripartite-type tricarboxylate transporter receptor subunit TctC
MKPSRRTFLQFTGAAVAAPALLRVATAQTYPSRPITMIVPGSPGGPLDSLGRVLAERMKGTLGQPVIIENVSGADGSIGVGRLARAKPMAIRLTSVTSAGMCSTELSIRFHTIC